MINSKSNIPYIKIIFSIIFGISLGFFYLLKILSIGDFSKNQLVFIGLYLILFFSVIAYLIIFIYAFPRLNKSGYSKKISIYISDNIYFIRVFFQLRYSCTIDNWIKQELKIIATGEKNINALGNEVRLVNIIMGNSIK
jgi:ABC-type Fe3+-siderophore transport system permease subunit